MKPFINRLADYSDESLLAEVKRVAELIGDIPTIEQFEREGRCSYDIINHRLGGLRTACRRLGFGTTLNTKNANDDELLSELLRVWDICLRQGKSYPEQRDLIRHGSKYGKDRYYKRFGSWIKACERAFEYSDNTETIGSEIAVSSISQDRRKSKLKRPIPLRVRYAILLRDRFTCCICGRAPNNTAGLRLHVDHIESEKDGGSLEPQNLRTLCDDCNIGKGSISE